MYTEFPDAPVRGARGRSTKPRDAFTLIELLVVITIITVLLALLVPAMDKAIYEAELVVCAARLSANASTAIMYTADHRRQHVYRAPLRNFDEPWRPEQLAKTDNNSANDDRPALRPYMAINKLMACPFVNEVDFDGAPQPGSLNSAVFILTSYAYFYGFRYYYGGKGMFKLGDRLEWTADNVTHRFRVLAADVDMEAPAWNGHTAAHPDNDGFLALATAEDFFWPGTARGGQYFSFWARWETPPDRGPMDRNFAFDDNSVQRLEDLIIDDERTVRVGAESFSQPEQTASFRTWLPE